MTEAARSVLISGQKERVRRGLDRRLRSERRFRLYGVVAILLAILMLLFLAGTIVSKGYPAFYRTWIEVDVLLDEELIAPDGKTDPETLREDGDFRGALIESLVATYRPEGRQQENQLIAMFSTDAERTLQNFTIANPDRIGSTISIRVKAASDIDQLTKGAISRDAPESGRKVTDLQLRWYDRMEKEGRIGTRFNAGFFATGDSREPEQAGIWGAIVGSFLTMLVTLILAFPVGLAAAVYLEEFAPKNRLTDLIEVNINNLAAVPSIVFGLLGLAVFLNFFELPRSAPLVGGMVLALTTLPTIIISGRASLLAVPPSVREAALGLGASRMQVVSHHVLPLAMPGILTGTIIGMARALGETAPLLMIGMVAFIVDIPGGPTDASTVMPVQIYLWADSPERGFVEKTSGAVIVLLVFLVVMNASAVYLRKKFERRW
ncbi:MAG: phosphate ABC transporter permease PstA [Rhodospirillaceae bacterium]|nr:phosphate ABC transporter permease PstA [Rhodospirillaceae bacterium]